MRGAGYVLVVHVFDRASPLSSDDTALDVACGGAARGGGTGSMSLELAVRIRFLRLNTGQRKRLRRCSLNAAV